MKQFTIRDEYGNPIGNGFEFFEDAAETCANADCNEELHVFDNGTLCARFYQGATLPLRKSRASYLNLHEKPLAFRANSW